MGKHWRPFAQHGRSVVDTRRTGRAPQSICAIPPPRRLPVRHQVLHDAAPPRRQDRRHPHLRRRHAVVRSGEITSVRSLRDDFTRIMNINALGVLIGMQEAAKQMIAQGGGGKIINTASIAGKVGGTIATVYVASKACVISLSQAGAEALGEYNITVNCFSPGFVKTPLWDGLDQDLIKAGYREEPNAVEELARNKAILKRVSTPEDLVGATTFLASDRSNYMTGQNLMVEGGVRMV